MQRERAAARGTRETHANQESVMQNEKSKRDAAKSSAKRLEHEAEGAAAGAFAGALVGAGAGPRASSPERSWAAPRVPWSDA
jgi:hypothetical protein